jgi:hypothetical protein
MISGFRRDVAEHCALLGCYAASSDIFIFLTPEDGTIGCPETSVRTHHYSVHNNPEERSSLLIAFSVYVVTQHRNTRE